MTGVQTLGLFLVTNRVASAGEVPALCQSSRDVPAHFAE